MIDPDGLELDGLLYAVVGVVAGVLLSGVLIGLALLVLPAAWERDGPLSPPGGDPDTPGSAPGLVEPHE